MAAGDHAQAAVALARVVEREHHVGQLVDVRREVRPVRRVLVPAEARALARPLEVQLVREQRHALAAHEIAHRLDQTRIVDQRLEDRLEMVEGLDHADRRGARLVLELDRGAGRLAVAIAVDLVAVGTSL